MKTCPLGKVKGNEWPGEFVEFKDSTGNMAFVSTDSKTGMVSIGASFDLEPEFNKELLIKLRDTLTNIIERGTMVDH